MMKMLSRLLVLIIGFSYAAANATPNSWGHGYNFGQAQFYIENEKNQSLEISCGADYGRSIYFSYHTDDESINILDSGQFSFLFDDSIPARVTTTKNQDDEWTNFNQAIAPAKKIQVFRNNQEVAVFTPLPYTIKTQIAKIVDDCQKPDVVDFM